MNILADALPIAAAHANILAGDGIIGWANDKIVDITDLVRAGAVVVAIVILLILLIKRPSIMSLVSGLAIGAFLIWGVWNITSFKGKIQHDVNSAPATVAPSHTAHPQLEPGSTSVRL